MQQNLLSVALSQTAAGAQLTAAKRKRMKEDIRYCWSDWVVLQLWKTIQMRRNQRRYTEADILVFTFTMM